jgi:hypothetical protein
MGLYDDIRSSYDLGEQFTNVPMQTKGLACAMCSYWIAPDGCLYEITHRETHTFEEIKEGDDGYNDEVALFNFHWKPTGKHGKVEPCYVTDYAEVYPSLWEGKWEDWPRCRIHFKHGKVQDFEDITGR